MTRILGRVRYRRTAEAIAQEVEQAIERNFLADGQRLPNERQLAAELGVSRSSLREALRILEERQVVVVRRGRGGGTFVLAQNDLPINHDAAVSQLATQADQIRQLLTFRRLIEPEIVALACGRMSDAGLAMLRSITEQMQAEPPRRVYRALDTQFHMHIAEATQNRYFIDAHRAIRTDLNVSLDVLPSSPTRRQQSCQEHMRLIEALASGDARRARRVMLHHIAKTEQLILFTLQARQEGAEL